MVTNVQNCILLSFHHSPYIINRIIFYFHILYAGLTGRPVLIRPDKSAKGKISKNKKFLYQIYEIKEKPSAAESPAYPDVLVLNIFIFLLPYVLESQWIFYLQHPSCKPSHLAIGL